MNRFLPPAVYISLFTVLLAVQAGCASRQPVDHTGVDELPAMHQEHDNHGWWYVQFVKHWPEDTPAPFSLDLLIADRVIQPVLRQHREKIALWRFHRRAARDHAGSKFSFIFYATPDDASTIINAINSEQALVQLTENNMIEKVWKDSPDDNGRPNIEDTSDREWPEEIQSSWPYFIMGVSQAWLALINELTGKYPFPEHEESLDEMLVYYDEVSNRIDQYWHDDGGHAYLHHLNALFGYRPLQVRF